MGSSVASLPRLPSLQSVVRLVRGDITLLDVDAFVFYAQPDLALGSGTGGAISVRGGASIQKELAELAKAGPLATGDLAVTQGGKLKARYILHAVGPRFKETDTEEKLGRTVHRCLERAEEMGVKRLAFPAMGAGYYGIPAPVSARVMMEAIHGFLDQAKSLEEVVVCVLDTPQLRAFESALTALS